MLILSHGKSKDISTSPWLGNEKYFTDFRGIYFIKEAIEWLHELDFDS